MARTTTYLAFALVSLNVACAGGPSGPATTTLDSNKDSGTAIDSDAGAPINDDAGSDPDPTPDSEAPSVQSRFVGTWSGSIRAFFNEEKHPSPMRAELSDDGSCDWVDLNEMQLGGAQTYLDWSWSASGDPAGPTFAAPWVLSIWSPGGESWEKISLKVVLFDDQSFTVHQTTYEGAEELNVLTRVE